MPNNRVLITGGNGDIGAGIVQLLKVKGYHVDAPSSLEMNLMDRSSIDTYLNKMGNDYSVFIHCAGYNSPRPFLEMSDIEIEKTLTVNLTSFIHIAQRIIPSMREKHFGRIVGISSIYGFLARKGRLPYVTAKHGLVGAIKTLAIEFSGDGIFANAISPGYIDTKLTHKNNTPDQIQGFVDGIPAGRLGTPNDIAQVVSFLCSQDNTYLTGQDIVVDGAFSIGGFQK